MERCKNIAHSRLDGTGEDKNKTETVVGRKTKVGANIGLLFSGFAGAERTCYKKILMLERRNMDEMRVRGVEGAQDREFHQELKERVRRLKENEWQPTQEKQRA